MDANTRRLLTIYQFNQFTQDSFSRKVCFKWEQRPSTIRFTTLKNHVRDGTSIRHTYEHEMFFSFILPPFFKHQTLLRRDPSYSLTQDKLNKTITDAVKPRIPSFIILPVLISLHKCNAQSLQQMPPFRL